MDERMELVSYERHGLTDMTLTVRQYRFLWFFPYTCSYRGYSTVWREYPSGVRQPTHIEIKLGAIAARINWGKQP
jgi:hypothetical protein